MEADDRGLERAYLKALPAGAAGKPMRVNLEGLITNRSSAEHFTEHFIGPRTSPHGPSFPARHPVEAPGAAGQHWSHPDRAARQAAGIAAGRDQGRVSGTDGCNWLMGVGCPKNHGQVNRRHAMTLRRLIHDQTRRRFTEQQKQEAIEFCLREGLIFNAIAQRLGLSTSTKASRDRRA
jgi:hypothetical protein